jgi:hypothetical protein
MRWAGKDCPQCYLDKSIKSTSAAKFKPIATPKPVSTPVYTPPPPPSAPAAEAKKGNWGWLGPIVAMGIFGLIKLMDLDSSPSTSVYTAPTNYYTRLWFNPKTTQIGVYSSTISHAHADTMASKACGVGCVLNTNPVADLRCLSVAQSRNGPGKVNFSAANDMNSAKQTALNNCNQNYGDCYTPSNGSHCAD